MCSGVWVVLHVSLGPEHGAQVDLVSFTAIWRREHGRRPCIIQQLKACLGLYSITKSMTFLKGPGTRGERYSVKTFLVTPELAQIEIRNLTSECS